MLRRWFRRHPDRIDPDQLMRKANSSLAKTHGQQERVNVLTSYLNKRKDQNGFGEDFEFTFRPKEAS